VSRTPRRKGKYTRGSSKVHVLLQTAHMSMGG